ncbi:MAG: RNA-binding S4 domain-containing protein, partial [Cyanobacteria bacterium J06555_12]
MNEPMSVVELGQFIKLVGAAATGGQAKYLIQSGFVLVNGEEESRRRKKLVTGDRVTVDDRTWVVPASHMDMASVKSLIGETGLAAQSWPVTSS